MHVYLAPELNRLHRRINDISCNFIMMSRSGCEYHIYTRYLLNFPNISPIIHIYIYGYIKPPPPPQRGANHIVIPIVVVNQQFSG